MSLLQAQTERIQALLSSYQTTCLNIDRAKVHPKTQHAGLILKSNMYAEIGAPETLSAQLTLYSNVNEPDRANLIGSSLSSLEGKSVSFAVVVILKGKSVNAETYYQFTQRYQKLFDHPGWMVKSALGKIWVRCATVDGLIPSLENAAATLMARTHEAFESVTGLELWFVTENNELIERLYHEGQALLSEVRSIKEGVWKERGFDFSSCQLTGHCGKCADKKTCQTVRKIEAHVKINRRKLHNKKFGKQS